MECLGSVVNSVTHNYTLVKDCFQRFFSKLANSNIIFYELFCVCFDLVCLEQMHALQIQNPTSPQLKQRRPYLLRSLFTVGVLCKFFDFDSIIPQTSGVSGGVDRANMHDHKNQFLHRNYMSSRTSQIILTRWELALVWIIM